MNKIAAVELPRSSSCRLNVQWCTVYICTQEFTYVWLHLQRQKQNKKDLKRNRQERKISAKKNNSHSFLRARKNGSTYCAVYIRCSTNTPSTCNSPTSQRWNGNSEHNLTSLVKQCAQRGAVPASQSSLSSSWSSGWTPDRWQAGLLCITHMLAHFLTTKGV